MSKCPSFAELPKQRNLIAFSNELLFFVFNIFFKFKVSKQTMEGEGGNDLTVSRMGVIIFI